MELKHHNYDFTCSNGQVWRIPVYDIALSKAKYLFEQPSHKDEYYNLLAAKEEVIEEFNRCPFYIEEWARNNMNFDDISMYAVLIKDDDALNMESEWTNPREVSIS